MPKTIKSNLRKVIYHMQKYLSDRKAAGLESIALNNITDLVVNMTVSDKYRRKAFLISCIAVVGQESCGVFALLQYAERVFMLARDANAPRVITAALVNATASEMTTFASMEAVHPLTTPARSALVLGVVQLVASLASLFLIEKIGRRPLLVSTAFATSVCLTWASASVAVGSSINSVLWSLSGAVALDSLGLQPVPYAVMADMFHYQYRGCALTIATIIASAGGGLEAAVFPAVASKGVHYAFALAAGLTAIYAIFTLLAVPETNNKTVQQIYDAWIDKTKQTNNNLQNNSADVERTNTDKRSEVTVFTVM